MQLHVGTIQPTECTALRHTPSDAMGSREERTRFFLGPPVNPSSANAGRRLISTSTKATNSIQGGFFAHVIVIAAICGLSDPSKVAARERTYRRPRTDAFFSPLGIKARLKSWQFHVLGRHFRLHWFACSRLGCGTTCDAFGSNAMFSQETCASPRLQRFCPTPLSRIP